MPPSQIVPRLADQGQYLASESSFYRILRAQGHQHHRGRARPWPGKTAGPTQAADQLPRAPFSGARALARSGPGSEARPGVTGIKLSGGQFAAPNTWMPGPIIGAFFYL